LLVYRTVRYGYRRTGLIVDYYNSRKFSLYTVEGSFCWFCIVHSAHTEVDNIVSMDKAIGSVGAPGHGSTTTSVLAQGQELGILFGPVFDGISEAGDVIYKDVNGDGIINAFQGTIPSDESSDRVIYGSGTPDFELGWSQEVTYNNFSFNMFIKGIFGHKIANIHRLFYENENEIYKFYNSPVPINPIDGLMASRYTDIYVENANFLSLENIALTYLIPIKSKYLDQLKISMIGQNMFTISNYSGINPEPILLNPGPSNDVPQFQNNYASVLSPGVEQRSQYLPSRQWTFQVQATF